MTNIRPIISKRVFIVVAAMMLCLMADAKNPVIAPSWAWTPIPPLGLHEPATIDTLMLNYAQESVPSIAVSPAYATTGNFGAEGLNMLFMERESPCDFFFFDALRPYLPFGKPQKFYNTRIPMTLLTYNTGGGKEAAQDRLKTIFSGNINAKAQVGMNLDYIYTKGSYNNQALKNLTWGINGSYIGDRYELQAALNHWNSLNKESGGITDDLYITDPAELQGGQTSINPKSIPTRLQAAHSRVRGTELYINNRYKVGYWHEEPVNDTTVNRTYIPVSTFVWTLQYNKGWHRFIDTSANDDSFWENTYLTAGGTNEITTYWSLRNTFGITVIEGFRPWVKAGLAAYITHEVRRFNQTTDTIRDNTAASLTPLPDFTIADRATENLVWAGVQLTKQTGKY
ncbi:MAG: putative porin, partial [Muribaculaceae bacterium]|nr:putative porin [Muribaculaceae bacterium]